MPSVRWIKLWRDLQVTPWRIALMVLAISLGMFGFTTMVSSYVLVTHEVSRNYLATHPASAILQIENIDADLLAVVRRFPGVAQAQASATVNADLYLSDGTTRPLKIFVVENFNEKKINTIFPNAGAWPPSPNTLLVERNSLAQAKLKIDEKINIRLGTGKNYLIPISGTVHDSAMPVPSMASFSYTTPDTLKLLGVDSSLTDLELSFNTSLLDADAIEQITSQLVHRIEQQGHKVIRVRIPPAGEHPHQRLIYSVTGVLLMFSGIALLLAAVITGAILDGLMSKQVQQIGVMKSIGGSAAQIGNLYLGFVMLLSVLATAFGIPTGIAMGKALCAMVLTNLNFDFQDPGLPTWAYLTLVGAGVLPPLFFAAVPITKAVRGSSQRSLLNIGTSRHHYAHAESTQSNFFLRLNSLLRVDRTITIAIRNLFRCKGRLLFTVTLLGVAGAMFMSSVNLKNASQQHLSDAAAERHYDLEISLTTASDRDSVEALIKAVKGVELVEAWSVSTIARHREDGINIEKTFSDGGHGALYMTAIPQGSRLLTIKMKSGEWLGDKKNQSDNSVVLNNKALESFPGKNIGDTITLGIASTTTTLKVIGIADQKMTGGMVYVSNATYQNMTGQDNRYATYRIVMIQHDDEFINRVTKNIEAELAKKNIKIRTILTETRLRYEIDGHFTMLVNALLMISVLMAVVGVFSLSIVMSTQISERTSEIGIMRSIGANSNIIVRNIIIEAVLISLIGWLAALILSIPVSLITGEFLGKLISDEAFPLAISMTGILIWFLLLIVGAILASVRPATKATSLTIRECLVY